VADAEHYHVTFRPLPGASPAPHRLRQLLKHALRALRLKAVKVELVPPAGGQEAPAAAEAGSKPGNGGRGERG
jgi:hypothetical protein